MKLTLKVLVVLQILTCFWNEGAFAGVGEKVQSENLSKSQGIITKADSFNSSIQLLDKKMTKIIFKETTINGKDIPSSEIVSVTIYRLGDRYARVETSVPSLKFPLVMIIKEPDGWMVDLYNKKALHMVDPDLTAKVQFPITYAFSELEFGNEFDFMKAKKAAKSSIKLEAKEYDLLSVEMYGVKIELICEKDKQLPHLIRFLEAGKIVSSFLYDEYKLDLEPDLSLLEVSQDLTTTEASSSEPIENMTSAKHQKDKVSTEAKAWALGCAAVPTETTNERHDLLASCKIDEKNIENDRESLEDWWGISGRLSFFEQIDGLDKGGHSKAFYNWAEKIAYLSEQGYEKLLEDNKDKAQTLNEIKVVKEYYKEIGEKYLLGWDYARYINLCRMAYVVGYITEEEAWQMIMPIAEMLQKTFDSWEDLGKNYIIGRKFWSREQTEKNGYMYEDAYQRLIDMPSSPWNKYQWNMDLRGTIVSDTGIKVQSKQ